MRLKFVLAAVFSLASWGAQAVTWTTEADYFIKQTSTAGASRYSDSGVPVGSDVSQAKLVPKTESTVLTTWTTLPYYITKERSDTGRTRYSATEYMVRFIEDFPPPAPTEVSAECLRNATLFCDPSFGGMRLYLQPSPENPDPCYYIKLVRKNGVDSYAPYEGTKVDVDGTTYCKGN